MARARNIKPGFFTNDELADVDPIGRLLFIGLWTMADREGRLEDRPRRIKAEVLPYDDADVDMLLKSLEESGFILRYTVGNDRYIQVLNFDKHQNPHMKEPASTIPAPCMYGAQPGPTPEEPHSGPADSGYRIPDSTTDPTNTAPDGAGASDPPGDQNDDPGKPKRPQVKYPADFEEFWRAYPSGHGNKGRSYDQWRRIRPDAELHAEIMAGIERWKQSDRWQRGFVKAAEVWLKDAWWANDPPGITPIREVPGEEAWRLRTAQF